ncbi:M20 family metallopeptidase [Siccirubricoccus phaeus]|uniref:M20 family metallopeptidase n=1 Tax=Siccirubricoccus phaeus TaxID=2595053 RepID=UPI0011F1311F|nr:M20 family metallopeptidase [Siccirubricoccus phaeus]
MPATEIGPADRLLEELRGWVERETPSTDAAAVNRLLDVAEAELRAAGAAITRHPGRDRFGDTLVAKTPGEGPPVVIAGHVDTVWDHGVLAGAMPFRVAGDRAYGPGIYDMKAGSFLAFHCVREILRQGTPTRRPITLLLTPDEEVGSPTSRAHIEREAAGAAAVLIPEPAGGPRGSCVTSRKGTGSFTVQVEGKSAHAGGNWAEGRSAVVALSRLILEIHGLTDLELGVTTNCAPIWGGTRSNVIPPEAGCRVDFRVPSLAEAERVVAAIRGMAGEADGIRITITGGLNRPPFPETPAGLALYERAKGIAARHGYDLPRQHRGGGSDGNFTAVMGIPTLDGLGCTGAGAHAPEEHIRWAELASRGAVLCELLETLG